MKKLLILLYAASAFAGQSLILNTQRPPFTEPNTLDMVPGRAEIQIQNLTTGGGFVDTVVDQGQGFEMEWNGTVIRTIDKRDTNTPGVCDLTPGASTNIKIRIQRNPTGSPVNGVPAMTFSCELWDNNGGNYQASTNAINTVNSWLLTGGVFGDTSTMTENIGFYRASSVLVPLHSLSPVTADIGNILEFKFDNTLTDSSGNGNTVTLGSPMYTATPGQLPFAYLSTAGLPPPLATVTQVTPLRAGNSGQLDSTSSFSMADASATVNSFWQILTSPAGSPPIAWSSHTASQPAITLPTFGDYLAQLQVTDVNSNVDTTTQHVGAVATDVNWIVVDAQPAFSEAVFGQQIAFGHNPWLYADWANANAVNGIGSLIGAPGSGKFISDDWDAALFASPNCSFSGLVMTCPNIDLQATFGLGSSTWNAAGGYPILWYNDSNNPASCTPGVNCRIGRQPLQPVTGSSGIPTTHTMNIDTGPYPPASFAVCTTMVPCQLSISNNWVLAIASSGNNDYFYYDGGTIFEAYHRRTGLDQPASWGQQMATIGITAPGIDQGQYYLPQARVAVSRQWAEQQVYYPTNSNFSNIQLGLRYMAKHWYNSFNAMTINTDLQSTIVNGVNLTCYPYCLKDVREIGSSLMYLSAAAYVETDPTWQSDINSWLEDAWVNTFAPQLQSDGHWDSAMGYGARSTPTATYTAGSKTVTALSPATFSTTQCGTLRTSTGSVMVTNGSTTITGSGTTFTAGSTSDLLVVYGTYSGSGQTTTCNSTYCKQVLQIANVVSNTVITAATPINLDSGSTLAFMVNSLPHFAVLATDNMGILVPFTPDETWYTCTYVNSTTLTLDQNFQNSTITTGIQSFGGVPGSGDSVATQGTNPYMLSFVAAGLHLGGLVGTTHSAQMLAASKGLYPYLSTLAWVPSLKGAYFEQGFANCLPPFPLNAFCASGQQNARMFGVEPVRALSESLLSNPNPTWNTFLTQYYGAEWGNPAYGSSPYSDGGFVDDCADAWVAGSSFLKYPYQCFAMGSTASMPAALAGGLAPLTPRTVQVQGHLNGADHVIASVLAPSGATTNTTCTAFPCSVAVDDRTGYGSSFVTLAYYNSMSALIAQGSPQQIR